MQTKGEMQGRDVSENRPKGEWLRIRDDYGHHYVGHCSKCGCEPLKPFGRSTYNFCPNCGADMRGT